MGLRLSGGSGWGRGDPELRGLRQAATQVWVLRGQHQFLLFCLTGGCAHGKLFPGDQILQVNNEPAEDLSYERAVDILRYKMPPVIQSRTGYHRAEEDDRDGFPGMLVGPCIP